MEITCIDNLPVFILSGCAGHKLFLTCMMLPAWFDAAPVHAAYKRSEYSFPVSHDSPFGSSAKEEFVGKIAIGREVERRTARRLREALQPLITRKIAG
jgi:hypothetical protein